MSSPDDRALVLVARPTPAGIDERSMCALAAAVSERTATPVRIADGLTTLPAVADAVAGLSATEGTPITASPAGFRSPTWSRLVLTARTTAAPAETVVRVRARSTRQSAVPRWCGTPR